MPTIVKVPDPADESVVELLSRPLLESHAGWLTYMRGVDYAARDQVGDVEVTDGRVSGVVTGTRPYDVAIARADDGLLFTCTCPMGEMDDVCKHVVALGIELLGPVGRDDDNDVAAPSLGSGSGTVFEFDGGSDIDGAGEPTAGPASNVAADVEAWLADLSADRLRELLRAEAARDPDVHRRLSILAAADAGRQLDTTQLRASIADAFSYGDYDRYGYVHYRDAWDWANDVAAVIDELGEMADAGFAAETVPLIEDVLTRLDDAVGHVDDSDGHITTLLEMAQDLHLRACDEARPDPVALAGRLLTMMLTSEYGSFDLGDYRDALGQSGLAELRRLAERRWEQVPALRPGDDDRDRYGERFQITRVMEQLAEATGDLDQLIAVMQRDLAAGYEFMRIAEACRRFDQDALALDWARRGLDAYPGETRLLELIGDVHADAGRLDDALAADRALFAERPSLERYQRLRRNAEAAGRWPEERAAALTTVRDRIERTGEEAAGPASTGVRAGRTRSLARAIRPHDGSVLVEILLWEGESDAVWAAANRYGCHEGLWLHVAAVRAHSHPADALDVYRRHLDRALEPADKRAYNEVVRLLRTMRPLYSALDRSADFDDLVADIRTTRKRRRTLIARLDEAGL